MSSDNYSSYLQADRCERESVLKEFTSLLGTTICGTDEVPKTRLDLFLSSLECSVQEHDDAKNDTVQESSFSTFPSLSMFPPQYAGGMRNSNGKRITDAASAQRTAIRNLESPLRYSPATISLAPVSMARAVSESFKSLVEANLRQFFKIHILKQSRDKVSSSADMAKRIASSFFGNNSSRNNDKKSIINVIKVFSSFSISDRNQDRNSQTMVGVTKFDSDGKKDFVILPIVCNFDLCVLVNGTQVNVPLNVNGTIKGFFNKEANPTTKTMTHVTLDVDGIQLLHVLRAKARLVAWKGITGSGILGNSSFTHGEASSSLVVAQLQERHIHRNLPSRSISPMPTSSGDNMSSSVSLDSACINDDESCKRSRDESHQELEKCLPPKKRMNSTQ